jgi:hypothetical protein
MQQVRGESHAFDAAAYLLPFALIVLPTCVLVAACAALFDTVRPLRGVWGAVLWFFVVNFMLVASIESMVAHPAAYPLDAMGITPLIAQMSAAAHAAFPAVRVNDMNIGMSDAPVHRFFLWAGMRWSAAIVLGRLLWLAIAGAIVALAGFAFDRYATATPKAGRALRLPIGRVLPDVPGLRLLRAELIVLAGHAGLWWLAASAALGVAGAFVPAAGLAGVVLPIALLLPLVVYGSLGTRDRDAGVDEFIASAPHAAARTIAARVVAAGLLGTLPLAGALVHAPALAIVPFAAAALAMFVGRLSGTPRGFEALYVAAWYLGPLNHMPIADLPADAFKAPAALALTGAATLAIAAIGARLQLRRT